jgi:hypothetical protein
MKERRCTTETDNATPFAAEPLWAGGCRSLPARPRSSALALALIALGCSGGSGCGVIGPSCLERQHRGAVTTLSGSLEAGQVVTHTVTYDARGSENKSSITWDGQGRPGGPRLWLYATALECEDFTPPPGNGLSADSGPCRIISRAGGYVAPDARPCAVANTCQPTPDELVSTSLIVFGQGTGGHPVSGYKLHVAGDRSQSASYSIFITWFDGPDC